MQTSPIVILLFFISLISCQKESKDIAVTKTQNYNHRLATQLSVKADSYQNAKKFDSAFFYYNKSKELFEKENDSSFIVYNIIQLARIQQIFGDYISSEETLTEALDYTKSNTEYLFAIQNLLGIASKELKNYDDAIASYKIILKMVKKPVVRVTPLNNIATVYIEQKKYPEAIRILEPLLKSNTLDSLPNKKAILMDNLGFAYYKNNQFQKGLTLMNEALSIRTNHNDSYGSIESHLHLADYYQNINYQKAKENALAAYEQALKTQSIDEQLEALSFLMLHNSQKGVNHYTQLFVRLNDSIKKVRNNAKNQFAKIRYDSKKATLESIKYKAEKTEIALQLQTQKNHTYLLGFGIILSFTSIIYLINYFKNKSKQIRLQEGYTTETRIAKKLHDELANDVFYTMTFAETQDLQNPIKKEALLENLDKIYNRTRNISKENSPIDTNEHFEYNLKQMLNNYKTNILEIIIKNGNPIDWSKIDADKKIAIQRVLQELMVNMKKYSQANFVIIGFNTIQNNIIIDYSDNGKGCSEKLILKGGLQNAENRIQAVNGILTFDTNPNKGFKATITVPK